MGKIGVPSIKGVQSSFKDFGYGAIGGAAYGLATKYLGNGMIGLLAAPVIAGSIIKGDQGTVISTVAGFLALATLFGGGSPADSGVSMEQM